MWELRQVRMLPYMVPGALLVVQLGVLLRRQYMAETYLKALVRVQPSVVHRVLSVVPQWAPCANF